MRNVIRARKIEKKKERKKENRLQHCCWMPECWDRVPCALRICNFISAPTYTHINLNFEREKNTKTKQTKNRFFLHFLNEEVIQRSKELQFFPRFNLMKLFDEHRNWDVKRHKIPKTLLYRARVCHVILEIKCPVDRSDVWFVALRIQPETNIIPLETSRMCSQRVLLFNDIAFAWHLWAHFHSGSIY